MCVAVACQWCVSDEHHLSAPNTDDNAPPESKSRWLATFYLCIPVGYALGYICGGLLGGSLGWDRHFRTGRAPLKSTSSFHLAFAVAGWVAAWGALTRALIVYLLPSPPATCCFTWHDAVQVLGCAHDNLCVGSRPMGWSAIWLDVLGTAPFAMFRLPIWQLRIDTEQVDV